MTLEPEVLLTWGAQLARAEQVLAASGLSAPRDEAIALLASLLGAPAALLLARPSSPMSQPDVATYASWVTRRAAGEATPHITGRLMFMGLELVMGKDSPLVVPGAQRLVELVLECSRAHAPGELTAAEIGAGCGAIALALASFEPRFTCIYAVDPSPTALRAASDNGAHYLLNLVISWREGDGLDAVPEPVDFIICGQRGQRVSHEDVAGAGSSPGLVDGPSLPPRFARLVMQAPAKLRPGGALLGALESGLEPAAMAALTRALPAAQIWAASSSGDVVIAVAQVPP
jgi:release factor glutamine methyltransferase